MEYACCTVFSYGLRVEVLLGWAWPVVFKGKGKHRKQKHCNPPIVNGTRSGTHHGPIIIIIIIIIIIVFVVIITIIIIIITIAASIFILTPVDAVLECQLKVVAGKVHLGLGNL